MKSTSHTLYHLATPSIEVILLAVTSFIPFIGIIAFAVPTPAAITIAEPSYWGDSALMGVFFVIFALGERWFTHVYILGPYRAYTQEQKREAGMIETDDKVVSACTDEKATPPGTNIRTEETYGTASK